MLDEEEYHSILKKNTPRLNWDKEESKQQRNSQVINLTLQILSGGCVQWCMLMNVDEWHSVYSIVNNIDKQCLQDLVQHNDVSDVVDIDETLFIGHAST